jgi:hypothetical protein
MHRRIQTFFVEDAAGADPEGGLGGPEPTQNFQKQ